MYQEEYYPGSRKPAYRVKAITDNNLLISPIRLTQRMIKLRRNRDPMTNSSVPMKWIDNNEVIDAYSERSAVETDEPKKLGAKWY